MTARNTRASEADRMRQQMKEYSDFVKNVLKPELEQATAADDDVRQEIEDYQELRRGLQKLVPREGGQQTDEEATDSPRLLDELETVDLGHRKVYCRAKVERADEGFEGLTVFVHVGMGFHVELLIPEALIAVERRLAHLQQLHANRKQKTKQTREHLQSSEMILDELSGELQKL